MMWQDWVFAIGAVFFNISIWASIRSKTEKPPRVSCALTAFWLWMFVTVYISFDLWLSVTTGLLSASGWTILFFQKRLLGKTLS